MPEVVRLTTKDKKEQEFLLQKFDDKIAEVREFLTENENCGFFLVGYSHPDNNELSALGGMYLADVADGYWTPEYVKSLIEKMRDS